MLRRIPPLEAIEAFVAIVAKGGVRKAAPVLAMTPSGVSRRLVALEDFLGRSLFDRTASGLQLNAFGQEYFRSVEPAIAKIASAGFPDLPEGRRLTVAASHSIAERWLAPRLPQFTLDSSIEVDVIPSRDPEIIRSGRAQFGIWGGLSIRDLHSEVLLEARARPVCAIRLIDGRSPPHTTSDLNDYPLLAVSDPAGLWQRWFAAAGIPYAPKKVVILATMSLMYEASLAGSGVALGLPMLSENLLHTSRLVPCGPAHPIIETYRIYSNPRRNCEAICERRFLSWLRREADLSNARFDDAPLAA